ncbi:MAG: glycosyltransferase family 2 protein [Candidatus Cloacimonetes bacterium]|nr:glycosyltransferase [Candidatus Cloacimonadota bacterium]MDD3235205.1 glycosyltransferase family 2 protein [Candidatus Cloacimonadota bacterium]
MSKVSVVVANYNNAQYLQKCLDSLLTQSYHDFEVLVFDDCSTDNSRQLIDTYTRKDKRFKLINLPQNKGIAYVRSICLSYCVGEYVAILDADDYSHPNRLLAQANYLDKHQDTVIVGSNYGVIDSNGKIKNRQKAIPTTDTELRWRLSIGNVYIHSTVMFRKSAALTAGGYDPDIECSEDMDLYCRLMPLGKLASIPKLLSYWRTHNSSYSKREPGKILEGTYRVLANNAKQILNREISLSEAEALFNYSGSSAQSEADYLTALQLIKAYKDLYWARSQSKVERRILLRCYLLSLLTLRKRNRKRSWYPRAASITNTSIKEAIHHKGYTWYLDFGLRTSTRNLLHLWQFTLGLCKP